MTTSLLTVFLSPITLLAGIAFAYATVVTIICIVDCADELLGKKTAKR